MPAHPRPTFHYYLRDGTEVVLGPVTPDDRQRMVDGLKRLSPQSRYLRFFTGLREFTPAQLDYFTHVDQVDHVAWGAQDPNKPGRPGMGLARFARLADRTGTAEFAVTVVDDYQRKGLGSLLLAVLYAAAERRGIDRLTALVLPDNDTMFNWMESLGGQVRIEATGYEIDLPVGDRPGTAGGAWRKFIGLVEQVRPWNP
jgi:GNAT superfamily N-acetyltransferase